MKRDPKTIAEKIMSLVSELAELAGAPEVVGKEHRKKSPVLAGKDKSGATGGIRSLIEEGKLDSPKELPDIVEALKQEGRHYSSATISMGLLNLVRERVLTRFRDKGSKKWKYAVRR